LAKQLFPKFIELGILANPQYLSLITPSRWFTADGQDNSFPKLRNFVKEHNHFSTIVSGNGKKIFPNTELGGVCYFLWTPSHDGDTEFVDNQNEERDVLRRPLFENDLSIILPLNKISSIAKKVIKSQGFKALNTITTGRDAFGIVGKNFNSISKDKAFHNSVEVRCAHETIRFYAKSKITKNTQILNSYKVFTSKGNGGAGLLTDDKAVNIIGKSYVAKPNTACTDSMIPFGAFDNKVEAVNLQKYMTTKFLRFMVGILKVSQNLYQNVYQFVPLQNFTSKSDINWSKSVVEIDQQLYKKYGLDDAEIAFIDSKIKTME